MRPAIILAFVVLFPAAGPINDFPRCTKAGAVLDSRRVGFHTHTCRITGGTHNWLVLLNVLYRLNCAVHMQGAFKLVLSAVLAMYPLQALHAQDLAPRAYVITPIHSNAITLTHSFSDGDVFLNNAIPVPDASGTVHVSRVVLHDKP